MSYYNEKIFITLLFACMLQTVSSQNVQIGKIGFVPKFGLSMSNTRGAQSYDSSNLGEEKSYKYSAVFGLDAVTGTMRALVLVQVCYIIQGRVL